MTRWDVTEQPTAEASSTVPPRTAEGGTGRAADTGAPCPLTERERQWLALLGEGEGEGEDGPPGPPTP